MILIGILVLLGLSFCKVPSKCDSYPPRYTQPYKDVKDCIDAMPFDATIRDRSIDAMLDFLDLYIYRDINLNSGPPYNISQDTVARVTALRKKTFDLDYEFQRELMEIVGSVKDAHTAYMPPLCFGGYTVALPFAASSRLVVDPADNTKMVQKLFVKKSRLIGIQDNYTRIYPEMSDYTTKFMDWEILKIDGVDAMVFMKKYAIEQNTYSRDKAVRFNDALEQFFMHSCMRNRFPDTDSVTFELAPPTGPSQIVKPKYVVYPLFDIEKLGWEFLCGYGGLTGTKSAPSLFRRQSDDELSNMLLDLIIDPTQSQLSINHGLTIPIIEEHAKFRLTHNPSLPFDPLLVFSKKKSEEFFSTTTTTTQGASETTENTENTEEDYSHPLYEKLEGIEGPDIFSYLRHPNGTNDKLTGVLQVRNFYPKSIDVVYQWAYYIHVSLEKFKERGVERLVVDLRKNGGGILCLGWMLVNYISPYSPKSIYPYGDMRSTEFWKRFYCKNNIFGYKFMFVNEERQPNPSTFLTDDIKTEKNGHVAEYSQLIAPECTVFRYMYIDDILESGRDLNVSPMQFEPENLVLLTDGKCGSTCGMVVKLVQSLKLGRVVSQGGMYEWREAQEMAVASFKGASVMMSTPLYQQMDYSLGCLFLCDCKKLRVLPGFQMVTFSWLELFPYDAVTINEPKLLDRNDPQPAEYHRKGADGHIWNWDFDLDFGEELTTVMELVLPYFGEAQCMAWEVRREDGCQPSSGKARIPNGVYGSPCEVGGGRIGYDTKSCVLRGCDAGYYYSKIDLKSEDGECVEMSEEYNMAKYLFTILTWIAILFTSLMITCCCSFCVCYLCIFGGFGWGCYAWIMWWQNKKYGKRKSLGGGYINVHGEEGIGDIEEDGEVGGNRNIQFRDVEPLLGEASINI